MIARVHNLAPPGLIDKRYAHINDFERMLSDHGTRIVKIMLHISKEYQLKRLRRRLRRPDKHWKFLPEDLRDRERWDDYMEAYNLALRRCSTAYAPWYVIPSENRWFRNLVISELLVDNLEDMNPQFPEPQFDPQIILPKRSPDKFRTDAGVGQDLVDEGVGLPVDDMGLFTRIAVVPGTPAPWESFRRGSRPLR